MTSIRSALGPMNGVSNGAILLLSLLWIEVRVLAGRPTMPLSRFLIFFGLGSIAAAAAAGSPSPMSR